MSYTYRYTGDAPTTFISLQKHGKTWTPNQGDTITSPVPVPHPLLELVIKEQPVAEIKVPEQAAVAPEVKDASVIETGEKVKES